MGYYVTNIFAIRTGGVFSGGVDIDDMKKRIADLAEKDERKPILPGNCISEELTAMKGSYVVMAGVFNYYGAEDAMRFAAALSKEFGTEVVFSSWDMQTNEAIFNIYLAGKPILETTESPIGRILRRIA